MAEACRRARLCYSLIPSLNAWQVTCSQLPIWHDWPNWWLGASQGWGNIWWRLLPEPTSSKTYLDDYKLIACGRGGKNITRAAESAPRTTFRLFPQLQVVRHPLSLCSCRVSVSTLSHRQHLCCNQLTQQVSLETQQSLHLKPSLWTSHSTCKQSICLQINEMHIRL